jgi:hypothetical protein
MIRVTSPVQSKDSMVRGTLKAYQSVVDVIYKFREFMRRDDIPFPLSNRL